jgi:DNA (cytosine-5)-methyltransferase 1
MNQAFHSPDIVTKNLKFSEISAGRRLRLSTNFLQGIGLTPDMRLKAILPEGDKLSGFSVVPDENGPYKVHQRGYKRSRSANPLETVIEFTGQELLNNAFPAYTERFHVDMREGKVTFTPMANRVHSIHTKHKKTTALNAFIGLTGGVDVHCMEAMGWKAEVVLEHRPEEKRDASSGRNLTEINALAVLANAKPRVLINEDIYSLEMHRLEQLLEATQPITLCHYSIGCDDHSNAKSQSDKEKSVEDLSTMLDMVYPVLKQIECIKPAAVLIENVPAFKKSGAGAILLTTLRRLGYFSTEKVHFAPGLGGKQGRSRYYLVASIYPGYEMPVENEPSSETLKTVIDRHIFECKDVTDNKSIKARATKGRNMPNYVKDDSIYCPTIMKSQDRMISDGCYIERGGRIYKPSLDMLKELMSIPSDFNIDWMPKEQATEVLGQSIDYSMHHAVMSSVTKHLKDNLGGGSIVKYGLN